MLWARAEQGAQFGALARHPSLSRPLIGPPDTVLLVAAVVIGAAPIVTALYAYALYPLAVWAIARTRKPRVLPGMIRWPTVTITVPVYNAAGTIRDTLDAVLALDYPADRCQLLVLSDASDDGTDDIVRQYADRGVQLLRAPARRGKTAAENAAVAVARGEIIVNIDATVRVLPNSLKPLIRAFADPTVGVASGRDVSSGSAGGLGTAPEAAYTGYEMKLREWETRAGSIVGASGCFYGIRRRIRNDSIPPGLSWDFASTLVAAQQGYRSVSVNDAVCVVPRTARLQSEMSRKARTMGRGISTLIHFRELMSPLRYGGFAVMLVSHKLLRWLPYLLLPPALLAWAVLAADSAYAAVAFEGTVFIALTGIAGIASPRAAKAKPIALAAFVVAAAAAGVVAWAQALRGARLVTWDPTPRPTAARG